ncbi:4-phosphoerythronate dehydrogenase PdxB [Marinobacterium rhizophilum]|uniref:Erythronate-4-phosphate dehydrogenase n=1 Tax=Marinobacterium rhizophilum TaxID=420402 RepID=A0ABY5HPB1_9GAMM|nr:4-phosphoerythronate dehydrogenase PdxB [Marinobacterium rhizophilum]UTW13799.1 4-phosphoerythronate dehydrogenase PdxB [Marinobacterium rhizophilum]
MKSSHLNIIADENIPALQALLGPLGTIRTLAGRSMTAADLAGADVLLVRSITRVDRALLAGTPVRFVGTATIGTDHVDQVYLQEQGIAFSSAPGCNADAVVEYVLTVLYNLAAEQGFALRDRTVGIVGVGNVGSRLQRRLQRLGVRLLLNDPPRQAKQRENATAESFVSLDTLLDEADILCLHTPLVCGGPHPTQHLLGVPELARLRRGAIVLNAGRGAAIDGAALLEIARARPDLTLVLDVWEHEPLVDPALLPLVRMGSPHIAGYTLDGKIRGTHMLYQALCRHLGLSEPAPLQAFLPAPSVARVEAGAGLTALELMRLLYDPYRDDRALRATLGVAPAERGHAFDRLRKEYPVRREFDTLAVAGHLEPSLAEELGALGFRVELS